MFSAFTERVIQEIREILAVMRVHDRVRSAVHGAGDQPTTPELAATDSLSPVRASPPPLAAWRVYDHCAAITRIYAAYERFVYGLVCEWLLTLPRLYVPYAELPESVRTAHRIGIAQILTKLSGDRYAHLSEADVIGGISDGLRGSSPYVLLKDAFLIDDTNLWRGTLDGLFKRIGVDDAWSWVTNHPATQQFLQEVRGNAGTADSELRDFVKYRNEAAHDNVDQVVSAEEIEKMSEFIICVCRALAEVLARTLVRREQSLGRAEVVGRVIRKFSDRVIGVSMFATSVAIGEQLIVCNDTSCYRISVESIEIDNEPFKRVSCAANDEVGVKVTRSARVDSELYRIPNTGAGAGIAAMAAQ